MMIIGYASIRWKPHVSNQKKGIGIIFVPGVRGRPYFWLGTHIAASLLMSRSPSKTLETSRWGSHKVNPLPMRSIAALLRGVWRGRAEFAGTNTKYMRALAVKRLIPTPNALWPLSLTPNNGISTMPLNYLKDLIFLALNQRALQ